MPRLEPKIVQKELDQGKLWPVYWIFGSERMKSRELLKRIRKATFGDAGDGSPVLGGLLGLSEETLDGSEIDAAEVVDTAQSMALGGGIRLIVVRDAHAISGAEELEPLLGPAGTRESLQAVCVFLSKDLDARKKFSKILLEKAAVVPCEEVLEADRPAWVGYLSKRRGVSLAPDAALTLATLEPWSLDIVDSELEKLELAGDASALLVGASSSGGADQFLDAFFARDLKATLTQVDAFARQPDEALPVLGLLAWNVRHLALVLSEGGRGVKLSPFVAEKLSRYARQWKLDEVLALQARLAELDFGMKQTPLLPVGLWSELSQEFCS